MKTKKRCICLLMFVFLAIISVLPVYAGQLGNATRKALSNILAENANKPGDKTTPGIGIGLSTTGSTNKPSVDSSNGKQPTQDNNKEPVAQISIDDVYNACKNNPAAILQNEVAVSILKEITGDDYSKITYAFENAQPMNFSTTGVWKNDNTVTMFFAYDSKTGPNGNLTLIVKSNGDMRVDLLRHDNGTYSKIYEQKPKG